MPRVKRGPSVRARHKKLLALTKGYRHGRNNLVRLAKQAMIRAGQYSYRDRRVIKRTMRNLWIIKLNAATRLHGLTYSTFSFGLKKANIDLDRKVLSQLAEFHPEEFTRVAEKVKKTLE